MIGFALALALGFAPDRNQPTGVANPAVTQATIAETICKAGWSATVRPPESYTNRLKRQMLGEGADLSLWELDHVWPIEDGGSPRDPANLRPQRWDGPDGARAKDDQVETPVRRAICAGTMTLEQGHAVIAAWILAHHPYPTIQGAPAADPAGQ